MRINFGAGGGGGGAAVKSSGTVFGEQARYQNGEEQKTDIMLKHTQTHPHTHEKPWHASAQSVILMCGS